MKKKIFTLVMFAFLVSGLLSACNSPSNISGNFNKENYVVSIDDTINFLYELSVEGIEKADITLSSSNENVLTDIGNGSFKAINSGEAYIFAENCDKFIAKAKVNVKYKFSSPKNISIDENGKVTWDKSFVTKGNQTSFAKEYKFTYAMLSADGSYEEAKEQTLSDNSFSLNLKGEYKVTIQALADGDIEESKIEEINLNNGVVGTIQGLALSMSNTFGDQTAVLSWNEREGIVYDVYLEGFKLKENSADNRFSFDYSRFEGGSNLEVMVVAKDAVGNKLQSSSIHTLHKLPTPEVEYIFDTKGGYISWEGNRNASSYRMRVVDANGKSKVYQIETASQIEQYLSDYEGGIYYVDVMALGKNNGLYLSSDIDSLGAVAKIETPEIEIEIVDKLATITFDEDAYSENYKIECGGICQFYNTSNGFTKTVDLSLLPAGEYNIEVTALPNEDSESKTGAEALGYDKLSSAQVVNSNPYTFDFFVLRQFGEISHTLDGTTSTISFAEIDNANTYSLYVNDQLIEDATRDTLFGKVNISFENLNQIAPDNGTYTFKVVAERIENGKTVAVKVEKTKSISILPVVTEADTQTNGFFAWNEVDGDCEYYYEVYETDSSYQILSPNNPVLSDSTTDTSTSPILELGKYYCIKIYTRSTNTNDYLNSDFVDENAFFTANFIAIENIETPQITFSDENDIYSLTISAVDFGGQYDIYVDGVLDGNIVVGQLKEKYEYVLAHEFADTKEYKVSVIASSGLLYDENLYSDSEAGKITVERLGQAQFAMQYDEDVFGIRTNENMIYSEIENSTAVEATLDGEVVLQNSYTLNLKDYTKFGREFTLKAKYIAKENEGTSYYIDSIPLDIHFKRTVSPSTIAYEDGFVTWTGATAGTFDYYEAVITVVNSKSSNLYYALEVGSEINKYDLQTLINTLILLNPTVASAYRQAEKLQLELFAFNDGYESGVYQIPSLPGTTILGELKLDILKLQKPVVTLDPATEILSWTEEVEGSTYDIYVDGTIAVSGHSENSIPLAGLGTYNYLTEKKITVQAFNSTYLDSPLSDEITIEEVEISDTLAIARTGGSYIGTYNILNDQTRISEVWINGSKANVNYTQGASVATFDFANFATTTFEISLKAKNESESHYYLDSESISFTVKNLASETFNFERYGLTDSTTALEKDNLSWTDFRDGLTGNSIQPIVYRVKVQNGANEYEFTTDICAFCLEDVESLIKTSLSGDVSIYISATVEKDYYLTGEGSIGYYGTLSSQKYNTTKIAQPSNVEVNVCDAKTGSQLEKKMNSGFELIFENVWTGYSELNFVVSIYGDGEATGTSTYPLSSDDVSLSGGYYHVYFRNHTSAIALAGEKPEKLTLNISSTEHIDATEMEFAVDRFDEVSGSTINEEGILTINDTQENASYFLELKLADKVVYKSVLASELNGANTVDLMTNDFFGSIEESGDYQISIIAFDENEKILPSFTAEVLSGYKLAGLSGIRIDDNGNVNFSLLLSEFENLVFTAKMDLGGSDLREDFTARAVEGSDTDFYISMLEILELFSDKITLTEAEYNFAFTVRQSGSIIANWLEFSFNYVEGDTPQLVRGKELEKDYILYDVESGLVKTTAFSVKVTGYFEVQVLVEEDPEKPPVESIDPGGWVPPEDMQTAQTVTQEDTTTDPEDTTTDPEDTTTEPEEETTEPTYTTAIVKQTREYYFYPEDVLGYWVTDLNGENGYFAGEKGTEATLIYSQYYVISVRDLLSEVVYGDLDIKIARVGKEGENYYQYNATVYDLYKLNKINDGTSGTSDNLRVENNILKWSWQQQDANAPEGVKPTAYYVILEEWTYNIFSQQFEFNSSKRILATSGNVDLKANGIIEETKLYYITVIAWNYNTNIVSSNESTELNTTKYLTPTQLDIVDGRLVFNSSRFANSDFIQDIEDFFAISNPTQDQLYHNVIASKNYLTPFMFTAQNLKNAKMQLKFTSIVDGGTTNTSYTIIVPATALFPDDIIIPFASSAYSEAGMTTYEDTYINLLRKYRDSVLNNLDSIDSNTVKEMINAILESNNGIGDDFLLIDDIARGLPEGEYEVSVSQVGETYFVESDYATSLKVYISASPELSLQTEVGDDGKTYYTATVTPTMNMVDVGTGYTKQLATIYKMQIRYEKENGESDLVDLIVHHDGTNWLISYNGIDLSDVISNVEWSGGDLPKFKINMNKLKTALAEQGFEIVVNKLLNINIFTYSQDDEYVLNGKSGKFNTRYLDLPTDQIYFSYGMFIINAELDNNYEVLVSYKLPLQDKVVFTQNFENGYAVINLDNAGIYDYLTLAINGSISSSTMNVASESYVIKGIYKLHAPILTTRNNNLQIAYDSNDTRYMTTFKYNVANDISSKAGYSGEDAGFYYQSDMSSASGGSVSYVVGSRNSSGDTIYPSELMAERFFAYLNGNSGTFSISSEETSEGDILLDFTGYNGETRPILASSLSSIDAIMLPYLNGMAFKDGDFLLEDGIIGINAVTDQNLANESGNIVYEIKVSYYGYDNTVEDGTTLMKLHEETHYSERANYDEVLSFNQIVSSSFINTNYDYFTLDITVLGALHSTEENPNAIKTIEGTYILLESSVYYGPNSVYTSASYGQQVLRSQTLSTPFLITRSKAPYFAEGNNGILNGQLHFVIDESLFYAENVENVDDDYEKALNTAQRIKIYAEYEVDGQVIQRAVGGTIQFSRKSDIGEENNIYVTFSPNLIGVSQHTPVKFYITIHGRDLNNGGLPAITSTPLVIENVYKLPAVDENYYTIEIIGGITNLNFENYFKKISIAGDYNCYKILIAYTEEGVEKTYEINADSPKLFELKDSITSITIQAQDAQTGTTINPKKLLNSTVKTFDIIKTDISGLTIEWNSQTLCFEWSWADGRTDEYEYFVTVNFTDGTSESEIVDTNYYMLKNSGTILKDNFEIRARKKTNLSSMFTFSDPLAYSDEDIEISLFSGGNGSKENPYLIANEIDFINIAKRNSADKQYYFKLKNDIEVDNANMFITDGDTITPIISQFYGILDGNSHKITITSSFVANLDEAYVGILTGTDNINFTQYSSLFQTISSSASIKNLYLDYIINYKGLNSSKVMFAPLSAINYGEIDNVRISSVTIKNLNGSGDNVAFAGGLVGVNYGTISNCVNSSSFTYSMAQQLSVNFGYGGIAIFNAKKNNIAGTITNCFNQGDKQVTVYVTNTTVYLAGISLANSGTISTSGNDGSLKLSQQSVTTFTGYYAGITVTNNGTLEYLYNNGTIENVKATGILNFGGIAYAVTGGSINSLVTTVAGQPIIQSCTTTSLTKVGTDFYASTNPVADIQVKSLTAVSINCSNGKVLKVGANGGGFKASIA